MKKWNDHNWIESTSQWTKNNLNYRNRVEYFIIQYSSVLYLLHFLSWSTKQTFTKKKDFWLMNRLQLAIRSFSLDTLNPLLTRPFMTSKLKKTCLIVGRHFIHLPISNIDQSTILICVIVAFLPKDNNK